MNDPAFEPVLKRVEIISAITVTIGLSFKILQYPFAGPMLVVGLGSLAAVYAIGGAILLRSKTSETEKNLLLNVTGKVLSVGLIGILFKIMYWPNATNMLLLANFLLPVAIGAAVWLKINVNDSAKGDYKNFLIRSLIVYSFAVLLYFTSNATLIAFQHRGDDEMIRLKTRSYEHPENKEYRKELNDYIQSKR